MIGVMPMWMDGMHDIMHEYERPMIILSAIILVIGWGIFFIGRRIDCRDTGCCHEPCKPKKNRSFLVLKVATILFIINVSIYVSVHMAHDEKRHIHEKSEVDAHHNPDEHH